MTEVFDKATELYRTGDFAAAKMKFLNLLAKSPNNTTILSGLADCCYHLGEMLTARKHYIRVIELAPENYTARVNLGDIYFRGEMPRQAEQEWLAVLKLAEKPAFIHVRLSDMYRSVRDYTLAKTHADLAILLDPDNPDGHNILANAYLENGEYENAITHYAKVIKSNPKHPEAYGNTGVAIQATGDFALAATYFEKSLELSPDDSQMQFNYSECLFKLGKIPEAWKLFEARKERAVMSSSDYIHNIPLWTGEDLTEATLLICAEQGIGDEIMYASMFQEMIEQAGHVIIECQKRLKLLFTRSFPKATVIATAGTRINARTTRRYPFVRADYAILSASLGATIRPNAGAFADHGGYLIPCPRRRGQWSHTLPPGPRIGINWRSMLRSFYRDQYYSNLLEWKPILTLAECNFINLQYDECEGELVTAEKAFDCQIWHWPLLNYKDDFEAVGALIANLDLVITPATSVYQLACAVGTPAWLLSPHAKDLWHPETKIFQRAYGVEDWSVPLAAVGKELGRLLGQTVD